MKMYKANAHNGNFDISKYIFKSKEDIEKYLENYKIQNNIEIKNIVVTDNLLEFSFWNKTLENWEEVSFEIREYEFYEEQSHNVKYVSIYETTRHFGGHEEGGWWYNWHEWLESHNVENLTIEKLHELEDNLMIKYDDLKEGDIGSVLGGTDLTIFEEDFPMQYQTKCKPKYE
jgi:hypothetical protein